ncbi:MAG: right-handed parallel beta-helix repeat-containing protein [Bacteroidota bacterium]
MFLNSRLVYTIWSSLIILFVISHVQAQNSSAENGGIIKTVYVSITHPNADDLNNGSKEYPLKSLQKAIDVCKNIPSKIVIAPGHYRSYIDIQTNEFLELEAEIPGEVFVTGSDEFIAWQKKDSVYWHAWPYDWGFYEDSAACFGDCHLTDYQKRREMVFVNRKPLKQVLSFESLNSGCFYVDENYDRVYINLAQGIDPEDNKIEVSTRGYDIYDLGRNGSLARATVYNKKGLVLNGLVFQHVASTIHQDALTISNTENVILKNCIFEWNNGVGLEFSNCKNVIVKNCISRHNGERGIGVGSGEKYSFIKLEVYGNNWRTNADKIISHDAAGIKVFGSTKQVVIDSSRFFNNQCMAVWFDWNNEDYVIKNSEIFDNQEPGIMVEGSRKRAFIINCKIYNNAIGIKGYGHANVTVENCEISGNKVQFAFGQDGRIVQQDNNWEIDSKDWRIFRNIICAVDAAQNIFEFFEYCNPNKPTTKSSTDFVNTVIADHNKYYHPNQTTIFPNGKTLTGKELSLKKWQELTKQDLNSKFKNKNCQ